MTFAPVRFAVVTDLHIGATTTNRWHNRFLSDHPEQTLAETIASVNAERPDFVAILGDLSDTASAEQLLLARALLDRIAAPWLVCQGNHDVGESGERDVWDHTFADRAPLGVLPVGNMPLPAGVVAAAFEGRFERVDGQWRAYISEERAAATVAALQELKPELLLVFCHFPFARQSDFVRQFDGKNAGTLWDGERLLSELAATSSATLAFSGHQHFHHIAVSDAARWWHCTTAAQSEFPAEFRIVEVDAAGVTLRTLAGAPRTVAAAPSPEVTWVAGRPQDRETRWEW